MYNSKAGFGNGRAELSQALASWSQIPTIIAKSQSHSKEPGSHCAWTESMPMLRQVVKAAGSPEPLSG